MLGRLKQSACGFHCGSGLLGWAELGCAVVCCVVLCCAALCCAPDGPDEVQEMDAELERYHKNCAALDLGVSEGKLKQGALHKELARQRSQTQSAEQAIRSDPCSCHSCSWNPHHSTIACCCGAVHAL